jgi:hypothetical protein
MRDLVVIPAKAGIVVPAICVVIPAKAEIQCRSFEKDIESRASREPALSEAEGFARGLS